MEKSIFLICGLILDPPKIFQIFLFLQKQMSIEYLFARDTNYFAVG